ncbi:four-helix bundle copper-binding protein [Salegentibacter sp. F188]|jgi:hypothetical protein|uniref:Four-helix bundle copper-binding protein n=3 Tax=Flavobacteriaceae TaxID=49546 RepID=A0ABU3E6K6_9FLAO|nr:four-helix bundle copper-binding protein [Salegentibacter sp. F188]MDT0691627.1 four-helix bundle copper-binding protein [Salegentibacter sp. F188]NJW52671.1 four-helix bundle copper-binding protein [Salinimicrobium oceani]
METGKTNKDLLQILAECATECDTCFDASLDNEKTDALARVVRLCRDCAKICYATLSFVASNSSHAKHLAKACADICDECAEVCGNHTNHEQECLPCMKICQKCAEACREFAA